MQYRDISKLTLILFASFAIFPKCLKLNIIYLKPFFDCQKNIYNFLY